MQQKKGLQFIADQDASAPGGLASAGTFMG